MGCISKNIARGSKTASLCRKLPPKFGKFEQTNVPFRIFLRDQCMVKIIEWSLYINNISHSSHFFLDLSSHSCLDLSSHSCLYLSSHALPVIFKRPLVRAEISTSKFVCETVQSYNIKRMNVHRSDIKSPIFLSVDISFHLATQTQELCKNSISK
jgi:hypothetical protein